MAMQWLDRSPAMLLAACTCGWRTPVPDGVWGWQLIADHDAAWHADEPDQLRRAQQNRSRQAGRQTARNAR